METWIKLYRKSIESPVFQHEKLWKVWCYCLLKASYCERRLVWNKTEVKLHRGQFIFGRYSAAEDLKMRPSTVWKQMQLLRKLGNCNIESNSRFSIVTILNWNTYQNSENEKEQPEEHSEEQQSNTNKKVKKVNNETTVNEKEKIFNSLKPKYPHLTDTQIWINLEKLEELSK